MKDLAAALVEAQKDMPVVHKTASANTGSFSYSYATLDQLIEKTKPVLIKNGLVISQFPTETSTGAPGLRTILMHNASGESIEATVPLLLNGKNDMQTLGGAITYARRYGWAAVLGIANDEDDDGNAASSPAPGTGATPTSRSAGSVGGTGGQAAVTEPHPSASPAASTNPISEPQQKRLFAISKNANVEQDEVKRIIKEIAGVDSSAEIPRGKYDAVVEAVQAAGVTV